MTQCKSQRAVANGFSLVELLIAMAIGLVLIAAILSIYLGSSLAGHQSDTVSRMSEDASIALETMARHIRMAGYSQLNVMAPRNIANADGQVVQLNDSNLAGAGLKGCDGGFSSTTASWGNLACTNLSKQPDDIAVRYEGDSYNTDPAGNDKASDCLSQGLSKNTNSAVNTSTQYILVESRFFISDNKDLSCAGNGSANFISQPLVSGVEFMRLRYGIARDAIESQAVRFASADEVNQLGGSSDQNWGRVVAVRICIQMVSPKEDQGKSVPFVDCDGNVKTLSDRYLHRVFSTTVSLRNRVGIAQ